MAPDDDFNHVLIAQGAKQIADAGGSVQLGAHGQLQGLGAHWELWMLQQGGMTPMEALRAATIDGARYLGLDGDIGSLEKGKLADLIVLDRNPLENIRNSDSVSLVMLNGRLYDAKTLNEIGNSSAPAAAVLVRERRRRGATVVIRSGSLSAIPMVRLARPRARKTWRTLTPSSPVRPMARQHGLDLVVVEGQAEDQSGPGRGWRRGRHEGLHGWKPGGLRQDARRRRSASGCVVNG